jgi:hypothetical protein
MVPSSSVAKVHNKLKEESECISQSLMLLWLVKADKVKEKGDAGGLPKMLFVVGLGLPMTTNFCFHFLVWLLDLV